MKKGRLRATTDAAEAITATDLSFICVGTPSQSNGNLDLTYVRRVCDQIGRAVGAETQADMLLVMRSTILPGTMRSVIIPALEEHSGMTAGVDFDVCNNPEFLREGSAVYDFRHPPKTVIGELIPGNGDVLVRSYEKLEAPLIRTSIETAEMVKYVDNVWHALKIGFANEVGNVVQVPRYRRPPGHGDLL